MTAHDPARDGLAVDVAAGEGPSVEVAVGETLDVPPDPVQPVISTTNANTPAMRITWVTAGAVQALLLAPLDDDHRDLVRGAVDAIG